MAQNRVERTTSSPFIIQHGDKISHAWLYKKDKSSHEDKNMKNNSKNKNESMCILIDETPRVECHIYRGAIKTHEEVRIC